MSKIENAENVRLFALNSNQPLARRLSEKLGLPLSDATITHFADGEISITINESVRGREVYVLQSVSQPVNTNLMELLIMVDALRRASAAKINVIMPYYGYARQDRKARSREPITAKLIANLLEMDQIDRLIAIDFHAPQLQGFFDIPVDHLQAAPILASYFAQSDLDLENTVIVAPDHAGVTLARRFAEFLGTPIAIIDNRNLEQQRGAKTTETPTSIIGDVANKTALVVDDIVDTGVRVANSAELLKSCGAKEVYGVATHAVLSKGAVERIQNSAVKNVVVTDTIDMPAEKRIDKLVRLSIADLLAGAVASIHNHESIHYLYNMPEVKPVED